MASDYPGALDTFSNPTSTTAMNDGTTPHAAQHADANDAIEAIQATLGVDPQGAETTVADRLTALEGAGAARNLAQTVKDDPWTLASYTWTAITGLSVDITPASSSSKILVTVSISGSGRYDSDAFVRLTRDGSPIGVGAAASSRLQGTTGLSRATNGAATVSANSFTFLDSPATTSEVTYAVEAYGYAFVNRSDSDADSSYIMRGISTITVEEIPA